MRTQVLCLLLTVLATGCASVQPATAPARTVEVESERKVERNYVLGTPSQAFVGEAIVRVKDFWERTTTSSGLAATEAATLRLPPFSTLQINKGDFARLVGTTERDGQTYRLVQLPGPAAQLLRFLLNDDGSFEGTAINHLGQRMGFEYQPTPPTLRFIAGTTSQTDRSKGWTNFELIYSGTTRDALNLLYREYTPDDMARPAFSQQLTYDRASPEIRFRSVRITVHEANNQSIRYTVEADGLDEG
ncbi:hypothetical protein [Aquimonas voraii]|uniref:Lipoprotein n=1 Tax=Aquimonas voraii TaxID=265719 RepID=A0A1G7A9G3_9GAMM|nr:hypothetical protein [Aquimonas voraii]SDE11323.1 hypothetical protein SAMN04488509_12112 [Aquimonas voraii]